MTNKWTISYSQVAAIQQVESPHGVYSCIAANPTKFEAYLDHNMRTDRWDEIPEMVRQAVTLRFQYVFGHAIEEREGVIRRLHKMEILL